MKPHLKITLSIFILQCSLFNAPANGQNLVPNPSFEDYTSCPDNACQIHRATGWSSYGNTPNYLNACSPIWSVPSSPFGYQYAGTGNAYASFFCYGPTFEADGREYIGRQLSTPLIIGQEYYVSFKIVLADVVDCGIDNLGVLFSTVSYALDTSCSNTTLLPPPNFAHVYTDSIITDTANWTTISGSFIADSAYEYIVLGNFFDDANTNYLDLDTLSDCQAHYLIDDVYVGLDTVNYVTENEIERMIYIYPNPVADNLNLVVNNDGEFTYSIYNLLGYKLKLENKKYVREAEIDLSSVEAGVYFIQVSINKQLLIKKIIVNE